MELMILKLFTYSFVLLYSLQSYSNSIEIEDVEDVRMTLSMIVSTEHCTHGKFDGGGSEVVCEFKFGHVPEEGRVIEIDFSDTYFYPFDKNPIVNYGDGRLTVWFVKKYTYTRRNDIDPEGFHKDLTDYYNSNDVRLTIKYIGPKFDVEGFGTPIQK